MNTPKNSGRLPAFLFYPADWRKDPGVQSLDYETRGIWFEIICLMHESDERGVLLLNGQPMPEEALCRLLGLDKQKLTTALTTLLTYGVAKRRELDGAIYSKRMVADEKLRQIRKEAGSKGGNPVLLNQNQTTQVKQKPTPSSSSSSSSSSSFSVSEETNTAAAAPSLELEHDQQPRQPYPEAFEQFWLAYPNRKAKGNAYKAWLKASKVATLDVMLNAIEKQRRSIAWTKDGGAYIPHPATWLNGARWLDEVETEVKKPKYQSCL